MNENTEFNWYNFTFGHILILKLIRQLFIKYDFLSAR